MKQLPLVWILLLVVQFSGVSPWSQPSWMQNAALGQENLLAAIEKARQSLASPQNRDAIGEDEFASYSRLLAATPTGRTRIYIPYREDKKSASRNSAWQETYLTPIAEAAFQQAKLSMSANEGSKSLHYLWMTLAFAPKHTEATELLKPMLESARQRKSIQRTLTSIPELNWEAGTYTQVSTPNFDIFNHAPSKISMEVADLCEQTYIAWQHLFFDYWTTDQDFMKWLEQPSRPIERPAKFRVVLFRNRQEFRQQLKQVNPPENSTGYYDPGIKTAFFYWDDKDELSSRLTIRHELVHQFFYEGGKQKCRLDTFHQAGMWVVEGVALYFESMTRTSDGKVAAVEFGGWDAPRLQAARYRRMHDEFWVPWRELHFQTGAQWRDNPDVAMLYSHAAGLTHFFMDGPLDRQQQFLQYVAKIYDAKPDPQVISICEDDDSLRAAYEEFLVPELASIEQRQWAPERIEIVLSRIPLPSKTFDAWDAKLRRLKWLDLSFTEVDDALLEQSPAWVVERLSLEGTKVSNLSLPIIGKMDRLEELDLSLCKIDDRNFEALKGLKRLKFLWLTGTQVTDQIVPVLTSLKSLELLEISETQITAEGKQKLKQALPKWKSP